MNIEQKSVARIKMLKMQMDAKGITAPLKELPTVYNKLCGGSGVPVYVMKGNTVVNVIYILGRRVYDINHKVYSASLDEYLVALMSIGKVRQPDAVLSMIDIIKGKSLNSLRGGKQFGEFTAMLVPVVDRDVELNTVISQLIENINNTLK